MRLEKKDGHFLVLKINVDLVETQLFISKQDLICIIIWNTLITSTSKLKTQPSLEVSAGLKCWVCKRSGFLLEKQIF